jgi:cyclic pyranopterin phosphate synthase
MVAVGEKAVTRRACVARAEVCMAPETLARIAAIQAAKRTAEWIPLCHPLPLDGIEVDLVPDAERSRVAIEVSVEAHARTGVEMEALVAAAAAGLTIYDMCKAVDRGMTLERVRLVAKTGGKSGVWMRPGEDPPRGSPGG